jgi:serine/threonine protein kinase
MKIKGESNRFKKFISSVVLFMFIFFMTHDYGLSKFFNITPNNLMNNSVMIKSNFEGYTSEFIWETLKELIDACDGDPIRVNELIELLNKSRKNTTNASKISCRIENKYIIITIKEEEYVFINNRRARNGKVFLSLHDIDAILAKQEKRNYLHNKIIPVFKTQANTLEFFGVFNNEEIADIISSLTQQGLEKLGDANNRDQFIEIMKINRIAAIRYLNDLTLAGWGNMVQFRKSVDCSDAVFKTLDFQQLRNSIVVFNNINKFKTAGITEIIDDSKNKTVNEIITIINNICRIILEAINKEPEKWLPKLDRASFGYLVKQEYDKDIQKDQISDYLQKREQWCSDQCSPYKSLQEERRNLMDFLYDQHSIKYDIQKVYQFDFSPVLYTAHPTIATETKLTFNIGTSNEYVVELFPYSLLDKKSLLGRGRFGKVRIGKIIKGQNLGKLVAIKIVKIANGESLIINNLYREIAYMNALSETELGALIYASGITEKDTVESYIQKEGKLINEKTNKDKKTDLKKHFVTVYIMMPLYNGGELIDKINAVDDLKKKFKEYNDEKLQQKIKFQADNFKRYIFQVCLQLAVIHKLGYIHKDVKPDNIIIDKDNNAHLIDFGLMLRKEFTQTSPRGSLGYWPPCYLENFKQQKGAEDVWAIAITLCVSLGLGPLSNDQYGNNYEEIERVIQQPIQAKMNDKSCSEEERKEWSKLYDLLFDDNGMLAEEYDKRMSMTQVIHHPYFEDLYTDAQKNNPQLLELINRDSISKLTIPAAAFQNSSSDDDNYYNNNNKSPSLSSSQLLGMKHFIKWITINKKVLIGKFGNQIIILINEFIDNIKNKPKNAVEQIRLLIRAINLSTKDSPILNDIREIYKGDLSTILRDRGIEEQTINKVLELQSTNSLETRIREISIVDIIRERDVEKVNKVVLINNLKGKIILDLSEGIVFVLEKWKEILPKEKYNLLLEELLCHELLEEIGMNQEEVVLKLGQKKLLRALKAMEWLYNKVKITKYSDWKLFMNCVDIVRNYLNDQGANVQTVDIIKMFSNMYESVTYESLVTFVNKKENSRMHIGRVVNIIISVGMSKMTLEELIDKMCENLKCNEKWKICLEIQASM